MTICQVKYLIAIGVCIVALSVAVSAQQRKLSLVFEQEGEPLAVKNIQFEIIDPKTSIVLRSFEAIEGVVSFASDTSMPSSFDVRMIFNENKLVLPNLNVNFLDGEWTIGFRDYRNQRKQCKSVLRIFRIDFHLTGREGVYWLVSLCLSP